MFNYIPRKRLLMQNSVLWGTGVTGSSSAFHLGQPRSGLHHRAHPFPWSQGAHTQPHRPDRQTHSSPCSCKRGPARTSKEIKKGGEKKKSLPNSGCVPDQRSSPAKPSGPCKCKTKLKALPSPPLTPSAILLLPARMAKELAKGICM